MVHLQGRPQCLCKALIGVSSIYSFVCVGKTRGNILSGKDNHVYKYLSSVSLLFDFEAIVYKIYLAKYNSYTF